jgi:hypothetical protein
VKSLQTTDNRWQTTDDGRRTPSDGNRSEWCRFLIFWCWPDTSWDSFVVLILYFDSGFWGNFGNSADYLIK